VSEPFPDPLPPVASLHHEERLTVQRDTMGFITRRETGLTGSEGELGDAVFVERLGESSA
jgi:hypothetical protein